jgi:hypothetical protein
MKYFLLISILFATSSLCESQSTSEPLELVTKFFNKELEDYSTVLTGEAERQDYSPKEIKDDVLFEFILLSEDSVTAVIAINFKSEELNTDLYAFLKNEKEWKIEAFRGLALPGFFYSILDEYKDMDDLAIKKHYLDMVESAKLQNDTLTDAGIIDVLGTLDDFIANIQNMKLTASTDEELIDYFQKHKPEFEMILDEIKLDSALKKDDYWRIERQNTDYGSVFKKLLITSVSGSNDKERIDFLIGGMIDNSVGYMYCTNKADLPKMSSSRYIMIREIGEGWYLYKTT